MGASSKSRRERWNEICMKESYCPHCGPNRGENAYKRRPKQDKYKNKRGR